MPVTVVKGDLLQQDTDVIVNAWNRNFIPWWLLLPHGVSGAIKKRAGVAPFRELGRVGMMKAGDAVFTGAGKLPHKGIVHVAALEWYWKSTRRAVQHGVRNALDLVADRGFSSVAFPALGAGVGGMPIDESVRLISEGAETDNRGLAVTIVRYEKQS